MLNSEIPSPGQVLYGLDALRRAVQAGDTTGIRVRVKGIDALREGLEIVRAAKAAKASHSNQLVTQSFAVESREDALGESNLVQARQHIIHQLQMRITTMSMDQNNGARKQPRRRSTGLGGMALHAERIEVQNLTVYLVDPQGSESVNRRLGILEDVTPAIGGLTAQSKRIDRVEAAVNGRNGR
jgi:hypothetical protein